MRYQKVNICGICKHCTELVPTRTLRARAKREGQSEIDAQLTDIAEAEAERVQVCREQQALHPDLGVCCCGGRCQ